MKFILSIVFFPFVFIYLFIYLFYFLLIKLIQRLPSEWTFFKISISGGAIFERFSRKNIFVSAKRAFEGKSCRENKEM